MSPNFKAVVALGIGTLAAFWAALSVSGLGIFAVMMLLHPNVNIPLTQCLPSVACIVVATPLAIVMFRYRRTQRRIEAGVCSKCGYDLRASTQRCPECGTPIVPAKS